MPGSAAARSTLKNSTKSGSVTASTVPTKARLASSLPRNSAPRGTGASSRPSSAPCSRSMVKARLSATIAASAKVTHSTLGARSVADERRRVAREVEHDQHQRREDHRRQQRRPAPQLGPDVLARDGERQPERLRHRSTPGSAAGTPRAVPALGSSHTQRPSTMTADPRRQVPHLRQVVGDDHQRPGPRRGARAASARSRSADGGVERGERLVQQQHPRAVQQCPRDARRAAAARGSAGAGGSPARAAEAGGLERRAAPPRRGGRARRAGRRT